MVKKQCLTEVNLVYKGMMSSFSNLQQCFDEYPSCSTHVICNPNAGSQALKEIKKMCPWYELPICKSESSLDEERAQSFARQRNSNGSSSKGDHVKLLTRRAKAKET